MIGVIGNGSWATALVKMLTDNQHVVKWWMRNEQAMNFLKEHGHNEHYLSSVSFDKALISPTINVRQLVEASQFIVIAIPSAFVLEVLEQLPPEAFQQKTVISAIKGILPEQHQLLQEFLLTRFRLPAEQYFAITGPCHAEEVAQERLSYLTFSGMDQNQAREIAQFFETKYLSTTTNNDLWGSQYAAVLKNIYAVGAGIAHGLGYGDNFLSVYITNCYREMYQFLKFHFRLISEEKRPDFHTSAYLGDLLVTCYSPHSRNRTFGALLGKGYSVQAATAEMQMVAEGYFASRGMKSIIDDLEFDMPIMQLMYDILWQKTSCRSVFKSMEQLLF